MKTTRVSKKDLHRKLWYAYERHEATHQVWQEWYKKMIELGHLKKPGEQNGK